MQSDRNGGLGGLRSRDPGKRGSEREKERGRRRVSRRQTRELARGEDPCSPCNPPPSPRPLANFPCPRSGVHVPTPTPASRTPALPFHDPVLWGVLRGGRTGTQSPATRRFRGGLREPLGGQALGRWRWRRRRRQWGPPAWPRLRLSLLLFGPVLPCLSPKVAATPTRRGRCYTCCAGSWAPDIAEAVGVSSRRPDPMGIPPPPTWGAPLCRFSPGSSPPSMCPVPPLPGSFAPPPFVPSAPPLQRLCLSVCLGHL